MVRIISAAIMVIQMCWHTGNDDDDAGGKDKLITLIRRRCVISG